MAKRRPTSQQAFNGQARLGLPRSTTAATRKALVSRFLDAVERGDRPAVADLLRNFGGLAGAVRVHDANGLQTEDTALHIAARKGHLGVVEELVQANAKVDATNFVEETPLMLAAQGGHTDTLWYLLSRKADPNHAASEGYTALMYAARNGAVTAAQCLLKNNADVNKASDGDMTPLHFAVYAEDPERARQMIRLLVLKGADETKRTNTNETPADSARIANKPELAGFIDAYVRERAQLQAREIAQKKARTSDSFRHGVGRDLKAPPRAQFAKKIKGPLPPNPAAQS